MEGVPMTNAARTFIVGSEGKADYLIVKTRDGTALGVKPMFASHPKYGLTIMVRLRVAKQPSVPYKQMDKADWQEIWPEITWYRRDTNRASTVFGRFTGYMAWDIHSALNNLEKYIDDIVSFLSGKVNGVDDPIDLGAFIRGAISPAWTHLAANIKPDIGDFDLTQVYNLEAMQSGGQTLENNLDAGGTHLVNVAQKTKFKVIDGGKKDDPDFENDDEVEDEVDEDDGESN
jgi:hypothetical protein